MILADDGFESRKGLLERIALAINGDRLQTYGPPEDSFAAIARFWNDYLELNGLLLSGQRLSILDVAQMMSLFKIARAINSPEHQDNYIDGAGYQVIGGSFVRNKGKVENKNG